jgi:prolyl-tRNA synthetase
LKSKGISVKYDNDDHKRPGWKFAEYEAKGVPLRIALGPRDLAENKVEIVRRDTKEKITLSFSGISEEIDALLDNIQTNLYNKALKYRSENIRKVETYDEFKEVLSTKGGFILAHWDGTSATEEKIKTETQATIRCIPLEKEDEEGFCMITGKPSKYRVVFAKAY